MRKTVYTLAFGLLLSLSLGSMAACQNNEKHDEETTTEQNGQVAVTDSISTEMEQLEDSLQQKTKDVENSIDELNKELE